MEEIKSGDTTLADGLRYFGKVRRLRKIKLDKIVRVSGVSKDVLMGIERGILTVPINDVFAVARALGFKFVVKLIDN